MYTKCNIGFLPSKAEYYSTGLVLTTPDLTQPGHPWGDVGTLVPNISAMYLSANLQLSLALFRPKS